MRNIKNKNNRIKVTVVSVLPRPRMEKNRHCEKMRQSVNKNLHEAIMEMNLKAQKDAQNNGLSYMDIDPVLTSGMYGRAGVHFNERGNKKLAQHIIRW